MGQSFIPAGYAPHLSLYETQSAISLIKRVFQDALSRELNLRRVSAPLFVEPSSGLNDDLNGVERPVGFDIPCAHANAQVVHSLAKWKICIEAHGALSLRHPPRQGHLHRHERHPPRRGAG